MPPLTYVLPVYVLAPLRITVPGPDVVSTFALVPLLMICEAIVNVPVLYCASTSSFVADVDVSVLPVITVLKLPTWLPTRMPPA